VYHYDKGSINLLAYRAQILGGQMKLSVHDQVDWFEPQEMLALNLAPANRLAVIADYYINVV
jgi:hypothetical protein